MPYFSVVICTFDRAPLLGRALDSLVAQEETDWEAVVVDDGSTDGTENLVRAYAAARPSIRYVGQTHQGFSVARNRGTEEARGRYLTYLDSDDMYAPDHLGRRRVVLEREPGIDLLHGGCRVIGDPFVPDRLDPSRRIHVLDCAVGGTFVLRPQTLRDLGGFPLLAYSPDGALLDLAVERGLRVVKITDPTYIYDRTEPDSMCNRMERGE